MKISLDNFRIRLKSFLNGRSWSEQIKLMDMPSDFEIIRKSRFNGTRIGNVIPFPLRSERQKKLTSKIKRMKKENNGKNKLFITSHL